MRELKKLFSVGALVVLLALALFTATSHTSVAQAQTNTAQLQSNYRLPSWWNGQDCDKGNYSSSYILHDNAGNKAIWRGIEACGPRPTADGAGDHSPQGLFQNENEWECTELVKRYLYLAYGLNPLSNTNGVAVVDAYTQNNVSGNPFLNHKILAGGSIKMLPVEGDVLSFSNGGVGHTAIVTKVTTTNAQTGLATITVIEQNASSTGFETMQMNNWQMSGSGGTVTSWMTTRDVSSPAEPGGWWIGPTPTDFTVINGRTTLGINFRASANNAGDLKTVAITTWTQDGGWTTVPASKMKVTQYSLILWDAYTEVPMPSGFFQVSVNVYSSQGYQLAPSGIRHYCAPPIVSVECNASAFPGGISKGGASQVANNIAYLATLDHPNALAAIDGDLNTEWNGGNSVPLGLVFPTPQTIQSVVVFDRQQNNPDNNQINKLQLVFSDGTVVNNIDMNSAGARCAEIDIPQKTVSWVNVVPTDSSGSNGFSEIQVFDMSGTPYSGNTCSNAFAVTPSIGTGPAPLINPPMTIFDDSGENGWHDSSFNASVSIVTQMVYQGTSALSATINQNGGLGMHAPTGFTTNGYTTLNFAMKASQAGQKYEVYITSTPHVPLVNPVLLDNYGGQPNSGGWMSYSIPLSDLGATNVSVSDIVIHEATDANEPPVYVDQIFLS